MGLLAILLLQPPALWAGVIEMDALDVQQSSSGLYKDMGAASSKTTARAIARDESQPLSVASMKKSRAIKSYVLGAGDTIEIKVFGQDDLNTTIHLDDAGVINYPFLGKISAIGRTTSALEEQITAGLSDGYIVSPHVNVSVVEYRPFYITGEVKNPGSYPFQPGLTLAKAITIAGGFSEFAARNETFVVRAQGMKQLAVRVAVDSAIDPGDAITVNESVFYIDGEVKKPGKYPFHPGLMLHEAIALAGGMDEFASSDTIFMKTDNGSMVKIGLDSVLTSGASISVQKNFFYIDGEVKNPGKYPLHSGLSVREAISLAGGLTDRASPDKIYMKGANDGLAKIQLDADVHSGSSIIVKQSFF